jgi:2-polyprenyl-3-methyl-5-hydroxy-6-metoxy-1,4-benzoquinol methylase
MMVILDRWILMKALAYGKIIDIGCNIGDMFGERATNVDIHSLEEKRKESGNPNLVIPNFVQADANHLPFGNLEFDTAVLGEILEHMEDPVATLNEAQRVAKLILFSVPNEWQWSAEMKPFTHYDHKTNFDEQKVFDVILESKLRLIEYFKIMYAGWSYFIVQGLSKNYDRNWMAVTKFEPQKTMDFV